MKGSRITLSGKLREVKKCEPDRTVFASDIRVKRNKANARERNRMHGLNKALDRLREYVLLIQILKNVKIFVFNCF